MLAISQYKQSVKESGYHNIIDANGLRLWRLKGKLQL